jgi:CubicO group peptidase (beta-lactamase class C family)
MGKVNTLVDKSAPTEGQKMNNLVELDIQKEKRYEAFGSPYFNETKAKMGEIPSAGSYASARALAKLGAFMANKGSLGDSTLLDEQTWQEIHSDPKTLTEAYLFYGLRTTYTKGGLHLFGTQHFTQHEPEVDATLYDTAPRGGQRE